MLNRKKKDRVIAPWRQNILDHHASRSTAVDRNDFPPSVVKKLRAAANGACQMCDQRRDEQTHHVMPRGRDGRGVETNGLRVCSICHSLIHAHEESLQYWIDRFKEIHGSYFWYDDQDWQEKRIRDQALKEKEKKRRQRLKQMEPVYQMFTDWAGRPLKNQETNLINKMTGDERVMELFTAFILSIRPPKNLTHQDENQTSIEEYIAK